MLKAKGFTLIEQMISLAIGLVLLSSLMGFFLALSKDSHQEVMKLELSQDYMEVASYLRSLLGQAVFQPHCLHPEWLYNQTTEVNHPMTPLMAQGSRVVLHQVNTEPLTETDKMIDAHQQYPNLVLNTYPLKTLAGSDVLEMIVLIPLVVKDGEIVNADEVKGAAGYLFVTDCYSYILGRYKKSGLNRYKVAEQSLGDIQQYLNHETHIQYYKIHRSLLYVSYEKDRHYLVHNFLDGSNHMRFPNVKGLRIQQKFDDWQMLNLNILMPYLSTQNLVTHSLMIRLWNL